MSLPDVQWRYVGRYSYGTGTIGINTIMDGIYSLATGTSYIDGSSRVQGSGSAGRWNRYETGGGITEAIYVTPPSGSQAIIIAGSSGTPSPTPDMCSEVGANSAFATNKLFVNIVKNPAIDGSGVAVLGTWNNATNPFSSGNSMGYVPFLGNRTTTPASGITSYTGPLYSYLFESKESIAVFLIETGTNDTTSYTNGFFAGALIDPQSSSLLDSESDGRLYGIISTGHSAGTSSTSFGSTWSSTSTVTNMFGTTWSTSQTFLSFFYGYSASAAYCAGRAGIFEPGTGNIKPVIVGYGIMNSGAALTGNSIARTAVTPSGKYVRLPIVFKGALTSDSVVFGSLRNIYFCKDGLIGQRHTDGSTTVGYLVSCSNSSAYTADAIILEY